MLIVIGLRYYIQNMGGTKSDILCDTTVAPPPENTALKNKTPNLISEPIIHCQLNRLKSNLLSSSIDS